MNTSVETQDFLKAARPTSPENRPRSISEAGVRETVLEDIALKTLYLSGPFSVLELSQKTRLSYEIAEELFRRLRAKLLVEVTGMSATVANIAITSQGRA